MWSLGSGDAVSPRHFIVEKGLSDARGEVDVRVQVMWLPVCAFCLQMIILVNSRDVNLLHLTIQV